MEEEFASVDTATVIKGFLSSRDPRPPCIPKEIGFHQALAKSPATLPSWITEEDVHYFAEKLKKTGFTGGLNYYRNLDKYVYYLTVLGSTRDSRDFSCSYYLLCCLCFY